MTAKPVALARARAKRDAAVAELADLRQKLDAMQQLLGAILERTGSLTFKTEELETMDPRRLIIVQLTAQDSWVVGLKDDGEKPLELDLSKGAMESVTEAPPNDSA